MLAQKALDPSPGKSGLLYHVAVMQMTLVLCAVLVESGLQEWRGLCCLLQSPVLGQAGSVVGKQQAAQGTEAHAFENRSKVTNPNRITVIPFYKRACSVGVRGQKLSGELQQNIPTSPLISAGRLCEL